MSMSSADDEEFQWVVGQSLTPKQYSRLGRIWEVGKVWLSNSLPPMPQAGMTTSATQLVLEQESHKVGGVKAEGLATEEDLLQPKPTLNAKRFGKSIKPVSSDSSKS